jgi:hypothetical protein
MGGTETIIASTSLALSLSPYEPTRKKNTSDSRSQHLEKKKGKMMKTFSFAPEDKNWNDNATRNGKKGSMIRNQLVLSWRLTSG